MALFLRTLIVLFVLALTDGTAFAQATATPTATLSGPTSTPVPCVNPPNGVVITLENPTAGDTLPTGEQVVMNGVAYDTRSTSGPGISSVTLFLGARDAGGLSLGTATLGQPNPGAAAGSPLATAGFSVRTPPLPAGSGARSVFVYARSLIDNSEGTLQVPVFLNAAPTPVRGQVPTPVLPPPPTCTPTPAPTSTPAATNTVVVPAAAPVNTNTPTRAATPTPLSVTPIPPVSAATPPAAPAPAAPAAPAVAASPAAVSPAVAQTTAPRGGGIPFEVGLVVVLVGAAIVTGGLALGRRRR